MERVLETIDDTTKVIAIQRSKGYDQRPSINVDEIGDAIRQIKAQYPEMIVFVDNCYGEFVETKEPIEVGADLMAGSLIKNPGGGLAKIGGYIVGRRDLVERCGYRLTAPGIGKEARCLTVCIARDVPRLFLKSACRESKFKRGIIYKFIVGTIEYAYIPTL